MARQGRMATQCWQQRANADPSACLTALSTIFPIACKVPTCGGPPSCWPYHPITSATRLGGQGPRIAGMHSPSLPVIPWPPLASAASPSLSWPPLASMALPGLPWPSPATAMAAANGAGPGQGGGGGAGLCAGWQVTTAGEQRGVRAGAGSLFSGPCSPLLTICLNLTRH